MTRKNDNNRYLFDLSRFEAKITDSIYDVKKNL